MTTESLPDLNDILALLKESLRSSGASGFVLGLSGGVDSAVAAALCTRAAGTGAVRGFFLPSMVTRTDDAEDVHMLGDLLGIEVRTIPIGPIIDRYRDIPGFLETPYLVGNLMARTRMTLLYYQANASGMLVCGTSNRTEFLLGYCTKHGDNAADVQPIIHLLKSEVWGLARILDLPDRIVSKAPSAGLWQDQTDEGEIGMSYEVIDTAIRNLENRSWIPETDDERMVLERIRKAAHKQYPALQVKR
ncbi:MAG: NAD(+) synthase [Methanospirillum sp.]|nr:NAD(+) synthase [Methanospirillum sp.]